MNDLYKEIREIWEFISEYNFACLFYWYKDVMKQPINLEWLDKIIKILNLHDLKYTLSDFYYENINEKCVWKDTCKIIYISRDLEKAILAKDYDNCFYWEFYINQELSYKYNSSEATKGNWIILWYPNCCIDSFIATDDYDPNLFFILSKKIKNYKNCHNYLNMFENLISHHIPCSFECEKSIKLCNKLVPIYIKSFWVESHNKIYNSILSEKTYILFKSTNWIKIENWKYYFWSYLNNKDNIFEKIKLLLEKFNFIIEILSDKKIKVIWNSKNILIDDIQIFHFPEITNKNKEYFTL
jgi:hypothetical protein